MHDERRLVGHAARVALFEEFVGVVAPLELVARLVERVGVFHVVGLVEDEGVELVEVDQANSERQRDQRNGGRDRCDAMSARGLHSAHGRSDQGHAVDSFIMGR